MINTRRYLGISILLFSMVGMAAFYWNEARKEVVYLCGNFKEGVSQSSVLAQLSTTSLANYRVTDTPAGKHIEFDSLLNVGFYKCSIEINAEGFVKRAMISATLFN